MKTPIVDFINKYITSNMARFHMPGHKGVGDIEKYDITEINGADYLHTSAGIIKESEENASALFSSKMTLYSTEGSSTVIKAMCYLAILDSNNDNPKFLATRNAHKSFIDASILLDFDIDWINQIEYKDLSSCNIDYDDLEDKLKSFNYTALYVTSPDYLGNILDLRRISNLAEKYNVKLLVDNAHGAYLKMLDLGYHPMENDVDMSADSAHKTLPCLTGGAYLHIGRCANENVCKNAKKAISLFSSTSPSYLILASLDKCNDYIENGKDDLIQKINKIDLLKSELNDSGYNITSVEPLKITIETKSYGYTGLDFANILRENHIEIEFADQEYVVLMVSGNTNENDLLKLKSVLLNIPKKGQIEKEKFDFVLPQKAFSIRKAAFLESTYVSVDDSNGKICGYGDIICPPAIRVVIPGEVINKESIKIMKHYGIEKISVIKE